MSEENPEEITQVDAETGEATHETIEAEGDPENNAVPAGVTPENPANPTTDPVEPEALTSEQMIAALNAEDYKGSELMDVLAQMEALISQSRSLPMSSSVLVNKAEALSLLESARAAMPADIRIANQIVVGANAVIARAQEEAVEIVEQANSASERIQADAHARAEELVNQERIVVMSKERAEMIIETATQKANELAQGADQYCEDKLMGLEETLEKLREQSAAGRKVLSERARFNPDDLPAAVTTGMTEENHG